jgi:Mg2+ and Co2+ transporter CorA
MAEEANVVQLDADNKRDTQKFWIEEISSAQKRLKDWHKRASKINERYLGEHVKRDGDFSLNFFHSNTKTLQDMLYSNLPKVEASRTQADAQDDTARVAAEIIERLMNLDIAANGEEYDSVLRSCLQDRLIPGLGCARVRYEMESETYTIPDDGITPEHEETVIVSESAPVEYYHWQDVLWSWGRSFADLTWIAFRAYLTKSEVEKRFGKKAADGVEYTKQKVAENADVENRDEDKSPWAKAEIWEIWDETDRVVRWFAAGASSLLDEKDDPLQLTGFFPCPPFLIANATTSLYRPTPDYLMSQDLYNQLDKLQTRIATITEAVKVVGVYDASADGVKRMLKEGVENDLIPVDEWAMFAESGGLKGKIDWLPLQDIAATLQKLQELRDETIRLLQQVTGMADVMQGQLNSPYEGVGQSQLKAQFGSVRVQALQDQFARFAGDLMQLKAEVICKHFEPQSIVEQSNIMYSESAELAPQAVQLLKAPNMAYVRIIVRPETIAMQDFGRLKAERTEFLNAMATFMQSAAPLVQQDPAAMPYLLKMLQWTMAGFKGSQQIEAVLDRAVDDSIRKLEQQQGQPDPQQQAEQAKQQGEMQKIQAKAQADIQLRQADLQADMQTIMAQTQAKQGEIAATHQARVEEIHTKLRSDLYKEQVTVQGDIAQTEAAAEAETRKDAAATEMEMVKAASQIEMELEAEAEKSMNKLNEISASSSLKLREMILQAGMEKDDEESDSDSER